MMYESKLPDMSCGHCVGAVTQACNAVDPAARVEVDLDAKNVRIESAQDRGRFSEALIEAGYPPAQ